MIARTLLGTFSGATFAKECSADNVDRSLSEFKNLKTLDLESQMLLGYEVDSTDTNEHDGPWGDDEL